jgi:hypothetical protein
LASGVYANAAEKTLPKGVYLITAAVSFGSNATGRRLLSLSTTSGTLLSGVDNMLAEQAVSGSGTVISKAFIRVPQDTTTYYVVVRQDSGASLTCQGVLRALRIFDLRNS